MSKFFQGRKVRRQLLERYFGSEAVHGGPLKTESENDSQIPDNGREWFSFSFRICPCHRTVRFASVVQK